MSSVLVVEDNKALLESVSYKLAEEGFKVSKANNGKKGLKLALKERPDIILLDLMMPKMGGIEMMEELRKDIWGKEAKVIVITNLNPNDEILKAMEKTEPAFYLIKSNLEIKEIVDKVKEELNK